MRIWVAIAMRRDTDSTLLKLTVAFLWALDTLHQVLISHAIYYYTVTMYGDPLAISIPTWSIIAHIVVTGISDLTVRSLFCHRVWRFSGRNRLITIPIFVGAVVVFVGSIIFAAKGARFGSFASFSKLSWDLYLSLGCGVATDILLACSLVILLRRCRTGFPRTDSIVHVLMIYSVNSGVLTSLCATVCFICFATMPDNFVYIAFYFILPKLLLNSLLATFNAVRDLRKPGTGELVSIPLSNTSSTREGAQYAKPQMYNSPRKNQIMEIQMQTSTTVKADSVENGMAA
ncbi:hypothetical protein OBBRIDRAFT_619492 [Obba rivulosa]|uniref:DUF6534 domain-containing protein n=1 Tax=Obba rivulosa TaxID=1052685 RepID=A0A8E2AY47_9APHY|nr:hypothetical protein OBBRIDRAFT_619492 [Obba rivulosa]